MRISDWSSDVCSSDLGREQRRIELIGIAIGRAQAVVFGGRGEAVRLRSRDGERIVADRPRHAACRKLEPIMMEGYARDLFAEGTELMDLAFADSPALLEIDDWKSFAYGKSVF